MHETFIWINKLIVNKIMENEAEIIFYGNASDINNHKTII